MRKLFLKYCKPYRKFVCKFFGIEGVGRISIPMRLYSNFDNHYLLYDNEGNAKAGYKTLFEALKNKNGMGITVIYDKY